MRILPGPQLSATHAAVGLQERRTDREGLAGGNDRVLVVGEVDRRRGADQADDRIRSSRDVIVGGVNRTANADFGGYQLGANLQAARVLEAGTFKIEPSLLANYTALYTDDYSESGAGSANLIVDGEFSQEVTLGTSVSVSSAFQSGGYSISPRLEVGYSYDILGDDIETTQRFEGGGASFSTSGLTPSRHSGFVGADVTILSSSNMEFSLGYRYTLREGFAGHNADAKLAIAF